MAINTIKATIQMRRGLERDFDSDQMTAGEFAVSLDKKFVRMCFAPGVAVRMATYEGFEEDMKVIQIILATCQDIQIAVDAMAKLAEQHKNSAAASAKEADSYSKLSKSYAIGTGGEIRDNDDLDSSKGYYEQSKRLAQGFNGIIPMGTITFADLAKDVNQVPKYMFNVSDAFTSDSRFKDGGGVYYGAGNNVVYTADKKWDVLASAGVTGVKGAKEASYRQGNVDITAGDVGAFPGITVVTAKGTDLNDYREPGIYYFSSAYTPANIPAGVNGWLVVLPIPSNPTYVKQIWFRHGTATANDYMTYVRILAGATIGEWKRYAMADEVILKNTKAIGSASRPIYLGENGVPTPIGNRLALFDGITGWNVLTLYDDGNDVNTGGNLIINAGGNTFIGSGEAPANLYNEYEANGANADIAGEFYTKKGECGYFVSDTELLFLAACQTLSNRRGFAVDTTGCLVPIAPAAGAKSLGTSAKHWKTAYIDMVYGIVSAAEKLKTSRDIAISGDMVGSKAFDGSANIGISTLRRGVTVGQSGSTVTNPWYKVATCTSTAANDDARITFHVSCGYGDKTTKNGILTAHFRTGNTVGSHASGELVWEYALSGINTDDFVLAYKVTPGSNVIYELWVKCGVAYQGYHFDVISEGSRTGRSNNRWALSANTFTAGSAASIPTDYTNIYCSLGILNNSIAGFSAKEHYGVCYTNAATAAKTVLCAGFSLVTGAVIIVKFLSTNTAANPTLSVDGTGAKAIYYHGTAITAGYLAANRTYKFVYNGIQYEVVGDIVP